VNSPTSHFYIEPLEFSEAEEIEKGWTALENLPSTFRIQWKQKKSHLLIGVARSPILGFKDDVVFEKNSEDLRILMRSESRIGYSDLGANRKRLESIRSYINADINRQK